MIPLAVGLGAATIAAPAAAKKKGEKPGAAIQRTYFLRRADCGGDDHLRLSTKDGADAACADMQSGLVGDVSHTAGVADTWVSYPAENGVPFLLDARKPIMGELTLYGSECATGSACLGDVGFAAGNATLRVAVIATTKGVKERTIGEFQESFLVSPTEPNYTSSFKIFPEEFFSRDRFVGLRLDVQIGGQSYGPAGISYDDPASFIKVPIFR